MKFYRYEDILEYDYGVRIVERIYYLIKETPCGYWISSNPHYKGDEFHAAWYRKRWVSKTTRKRFAYPTQEEAMVNFFYRKARQVTIYTARLERAKKALKKAEARIENVDGRHTNVNISAKAFRLS